MREGSERRRTTPRRSPPPPAASAAAGRPSRWRCPPAGGWRARLRRARRRATQSRWTKALRAWRARGGAVRGCACSPAHGGTEGAPQRAKNALESINARARCARESLIARAVVLYVHLATPAPERCCLRPERNAGSNAARRCAAALSSRPSLLALLDDASRRLSHRLRRRLLSRAHRHQRPPGRPLLPHLRRPRLALRRRAAAPSHCWQLLPGGDKRDGGSPVPPRVRSRRRGRSTPPGRASARPACSPSPSLSPAWWTGCPRGASCAWPRACFATERSTRR